MIVTWWRMVGEVGGKSEMDQVVWRRDGAVGGSAGILFVICGDGRWEPNARRKCIFRSGEEGLALEWLWMI